MQGPRLIQFWRPLSQRYEEKKRKSVRRAEYGDSDALNLRSVKNSKS